MSAPKVGPTPGPWVRYEDQRPESEGIYAWRVPSVALSGALVTFHAWMRVRGAGFKTVISPSFDHWDGYRVQVPSGTEWRPADDGAECKWHEVVRVGVEGLDFCVCPYCNKTPILDGYQRGASGGIVVSNDVHRFNHWWLNCCAWGKTPALSDPREIERIRRAALAKAVQL